MLTLLEIVKRSTDFLAQKQVESPRLNAETIIGHALGLPRMQLYMQFERPLTDADLEKIRPLIKRRSLREPLQHIIGEVEFFGVKLKTDKRALIPRPETERMVELVTERLKSNIPASVLDLGTGSGAIAIALAAHWPTSRIVATDQSQIALELAAENAALNGVTERIEFIESDWFASEKIGSSFPLIVSNPPYLCETEVLESQPEVRSFEPASALTPGGDGLSSLRTIVDGARAHLADGGWLVLETGISQHAVLAQLLKSSGYVAIESLTDLTGRNRFVFAQRTE